MSVSDGNEKKFVIKHVFKNVKNQFIEKEDGTEMIGSVQEHHGVEWKLRLVKRKVIFDYIDFHLDCVVTGQRGNWSIATKFDVLANGKRIGTSTEGVFSKDCRSNNYRTCIIFFNCDEYTTNGGMPVEFHVTIKKITGIGQRKLRNFDQISAGQFSDVVLVVGGQKFYVIKNFLAMHSTYFEAMFSGSFAEAQKSEIELKDIDPEHFQNFLELINGESLVTDHTVEGILHLADFFGAKTAIKRCHDFLLTNSKLSQKKKFALAIKCGFDDVKKKCLSKMKTKNDVKNVLPDDPALLHPSILAELLEKMYILK